MPYQGTFLRHEPGQYGGKVVFQTERGEWSMDNRTPQGTAFPAPGTQVSFEAEKRDNKWWGCKSINANGQTPQQTAYQAQAPVQTPAQQLDPKAMEIFVTGVIGRCFHGTGQIPSSDVLAAMVESCARAFRDGMAQANAVSGDPGPQGPDDYYQ